MRRAVSTQSSGSRASLRDFALTVPVHVGVGRRRDGRGCGGDRRGESGGEQCRHAQRGSGYSTVHQLTARAVNLGKNWVRKKSALRIAQTLEELGEKKKSLLLTLTAHHGIGQVPVLEYGRTGQSVPIRPFLQ